MLSPQLTKFILSYQNDNKETYKKDNDKTLSCDTTKKTKSVKFMTKLGFVPVHVDK